MESGEIRRRALLVATDQYNDPGLRQLIAPGGDSDRLAGLLLDPGVGFFDDVEVIRNEQEWAIRRKIGKFLGEGRREDLLLLYFSCHGLKEAGRLYLRRRTPISPTSTRRRSLRSF
jgi:hypothetical protein